MYNSAIALSDTEIIQNAVILLFVNDIDEVVCGAVQALFPVWFEDIKARISSETRTKGCLAHYVKKHKILERFI